MLPFCPALVTVLIAIHLFFVQWQGMSVPPKVEVKWMENPSLKREMKFFPNFVLRELMAWYVAVGVLGALAAIFPWDLGAKADPFVSAPAGIKPEWYFLFMYQTLKLIPGQSVVCRRRSFGHTWLRSRRAVLASAAFL